MKELVQIPRYYRPYPYQAAAWKRRNSGKYVYYFKLWARQLGKDTDDIEHAMNIGYLNPGIQIAYVGLDNVWINNNIFKKYIEGRTFWDDYPEELIDPKDTAKEVYMRSMDKDRADARIKFIGFLNDQGLIGSSYDRFYVSEASLYPSHGFQYIRPIWDRKLKMGAELQVNFNGTPRGVKNVLYDLLRVYTGEDEPDAFPGEHGNCYVDKITIADAVNHRGERLYSDEEIEQLRSHYIREFGNDNLFRQENFCDFTVVNAGLVYLAIEQLVREHRYTPYNLDTTKPVYIAFDIASKGKESDSTAAVMFQYINNRMIMYDCFESRGIALVEAMQEIMKKPYAHMIRMGILPWDSERSASSQTPIEEARAMFPKINWHALDKERVDRGIRLVREQLPNMIINSENCGWLMECFQNYEYKRLERADDWAAKPMHNKFSHMMDACLQEDTLVETLAGTRKISEIPECGYIFTPQGFLPYWNCGIRRIDNIWYDIELESGETISCTADHVFPTIDGLKYTEQLTLSDMLWYNNIANSPSERLYNGRQKDSQGITERDRADRVEWKDVVALSRRTLLSTQRRTPPPRCIQALLRGNTEGLPCSSCGRRCQEQLTREFNSDFSFGAFEYAYVKPRKNRETKKNRPEKLEESGREKKRMGKDGRRESLVQGTLEEQYWEINDSYRKRVPTLPQEVYLKGSSEDCKILLRKLQNESSTSKIKRITRRCCTSEAWCLEVEGQLFYANGILTKNCRYAAMGLKEIQYFNLNDDGSETLDWNMTYEGMFEEQKPEYDGDPIWMTEKQRKEKRTNAGLYYYG